MGSLKEFQDLINDLDDEELLNAAQSVLQDLVEIENMREKMEMLEAGLTKGNKAAFWFFAMGLDREQVDLASNTVIGRKRFLQDMAERAKMAEKANAPEPEEAQVDDVIACLVCNRMPCDCTN